MTAPDRHAEAMERVRRILRGDVEHFRRRIDAQPADDAAKDAEQADRRAYVRALFAFLDASVDQQRHRLLELDAENRIRLQPDERVVLREVRHDVGRNGAIEPYPHHLSFTRKLRLIGRVAERVHGGSFTDDFADGGWGELRRAVAVRDRVTHPKAVADCLVTAEEMRLLTAGEAWYRRFHDRLVRAGDAAKED